MYLFFRLFADGFFFVVFSFGFGGHSATGLQTLARQSHWSLSSKRKGASKDRAKLPSSVRNDLMTTQTMRH
jgi:hypothetical protein